MVSREADRTCLYCFSEADGLGRSITNMHCPPGRVVHHISVKISYNLILWFSIYILGVFLLKSSPLVHRNRGLFLLVFFLHKSNSSTKYLFHWRFARSYLVENHNSLKLSQPFYHILKSQILYLYSRGLQCSGCNHAKVMTGAINPAILYGPQGDEVSNC